jgi:hypothetical protein
METTLERPKAKLSDLTFDQMAAMRLKLNEQIKDAEVVVSEIKAKREKIDVEFLRRFNEQGLQNVKTKHGTPYIIERTTVSVADKDAFWKWMEKNNAFDFMEVRASKKMVESYKEEHEDLPPGLNWNASLTIGMNRK